MNYKMIDECGKAFVLEQKTGLKYGPYDNKEAARTHMRFMNLGGVFDGYTPRFILQ